jgi:hypothetical protein
MPRALRDGVAGGLSPTASIDSGTDGGAGATGGAKAPKSILKTPATLAAKREAERARLVAAMGAELQFKVLVLGARGVVSGWLARMWVDRSAGGGGRRR